MTQGDGQDATIFKLQWGIVAQPYKVQIHFAWKQRSKNDWSTNVGSTQVPTPLTGRRQCFSHVMRLVLDTAFARDDFLASTG
jgi:hypothetical protein